MARYEPRDATYQQAKRAGLRSRAGVKLEDLDRRFQLLRPGAKVLDLGCWPGAWLQVAAARVGDAGAVVGVDLVEADPLPLLPCVTILRGDVRDTSVQDQLRETLGGPADLVLSDMAPKLTGVRASDNARHADLAHTAVVIAADFLTDRGTLVLKLFSGVESEITAELKAAFTRVTKLRPESTRRGSSEIYAVASQPRR
jgi:23S rRNA (uridine2552-2'-O)-methyltransferase